MPSLFEIGKSGLQAYRQSLAVTGQNIANVNTEGYKKRDAALAEVSGAGGGITEISDQTGLGVRVEEIRRSFDEFLLDKARQTSSIFEKADTFLNEVKDLENLLLPSDNNLSSSIGNFFNSLQEIAIAPEDQAPRIVANERGKDLASQFNLYADRIDNLQGRIKRQADNAVTSVNLLTSQLSDINEDLLTSGLTSQASNAKLDQRDNLIDKLSKIAQVTVNYGSRGEALVRLGNTGSGPIILEKDKNVTIDILKQGQRLQAVVGLNKVATNQIQGGIISGLTDAYALASDTKSEIDNLALIVTSKFNDVNKNGLNLDGEKGKDMFSTNSLSATPNPTNRSSVGVEISVLDPSKVIKDNYSLDYNEDNDRWTLSSNSLSKPITGSNNIQTTGFTITFFGDPQDGDSFSIEPVSESKGMQYLFSRPQDIAAASTTLISSSTKNLGTAKLEEIALIASTDKTNIGNLNSVFSNSLSPVTSSSFTENGGLAIIPKGTEFVNLSSYKTQPTVKFSLSSTDVTSLTSIDLGLSDSSTVTVDLTGVSTIEEVAEKLNSSRDVNGTAHNFRTKGLFASGGGSSLTLASNNLTFTSATVSTGSTINGVINNPTVSAASDLQIFTREGRHLAGTVLTTAQVATFLTEENGFNTEVEYRADYLNGKNTDAYRGIEIDRSTKNGNYALSYGANGAAASAQRSTSAVPASHVTAAYTLKVTSATAGSQEISVPVSSSAGYVAGLINTNAKNLGIRASAKTIVKLNPVTSDGNMSFTLKSKAGTNASVSIAADIVTTDMTNLATSINNFSGRTGVTAYLSEDKEYIILENEDGDDIEISNFSGTGSGGTFTVLKQDYSTTGQSITLNSGSNKFGRLSGELRLESSSSFTTTNDGGSTTKSSTQDALSDGYFNITASKTGESKTIKPKTFEGDLSSSHPEGLDASSSVLSYGITLAGTGTSSNFTSTVNASQFESVSPSIISKKLAENLRSNSPSVEIIGNSIDTIPSDGSSFKIDHDGLTYNISMENGEVVIDGGEEGLLTAFFEDPKSLTINTSGFSNTSTITNTEHGLETGDAIVYNAAEKVLVDTTNFSSTTSITAKSHGFSTGDPIIYKANGSLAINGLTDGTTYYAIRVDENTFKLATSTTNASNNTPLTITGDSGGSVSDSFTSPINGLIDGTTYYAVKTDNHNFRIASSYALATNSSPSVITITGGSGGNALDTFDPGQRLYISAGKTISASQFSFSTDSINDANATAFGMLDTNIKTTITGKSITTPSASNTSHLHLKLDEYASTIGVFVRANSKTINTSSISSSSTTLTSSGHGFKTGDKIVYTAAASNLTGLTSGTSYFAKVIDANTFSLASTYANATAESPTLLSFGGGGGNASDTFAGVFAEAYINDDISSPTTAASLGITVDINQVSDTNAQITINKEADKKDITVNTVTYSDGSTAEGFGFFTNLTQVNVIGDELKFKSISTDVSNSENVAVSASGVDSIAGSNISLSNLPPEDLIIISTGNGSRKFAANYGNINSLVDSSEFRFVIDSANNSKLEVLDGDTLQSIATRLIPVDGKFSAIEKSFKLTGESQVNDSFDLQNNNDGIGDNRNIMEMIGLQEADVLGLNSGSFQDIFNATAAEIGTTVRSGEMTADSAQASRDEAKALEDERSGISMDEEASALIQFQQAYSANARIIQTAKELFESLMTVI